MRIYIPKSVLVLVFALIAFTGFRYKNDLFEFGKNLELFSHVFKTVQDSYVDEVPASELAQTAIKQMLKSLDPYTVFYSEYQAEEAMIERQGEYGGVGAQILIRDGWPMVMDLQKGYGFDLAGIRRGDILTHVGTISLQGLSLDDMMQYFRGAPNSTFEISILRNNQSIKKTIKRSIVEQKSVSYHGIFRESFGYIKLDEFGRDCAKEIAQALKTQIDSHHIKGLVLDLRNNGGGLLNEAVDIVGLFVPKNTVIVTLKGAHKTGPTKWPTTAEPIAPHLPLIVLINESSASASEVVSGSLQDLDRALIIGSNSFGKGLVQNYQNLPYRTQMKITTARYHIPSGRCIQKIQYGKTAGSPKQTFKTTNGRSVVDGNGVTPDVNIDKLAQSNWLDWMKKAHLFFDFANEFEAKFDEKTFSEPFTVLSKFADFAKNSGAERFLQQSRERIFSHKDSTIYRHIFDVNAQRSQIEKTILQQIKDHSEWYLYELRHEFFHRWYSKSTYHQKMLQFDPLLLLAHRYLNKTESLNSILKP